MNKRIMAAVLAGTVLLAVAAFGPFGFGAATNPSATTPANANLTVQSIGVVDPARIQKDFPAYQRLLEMKGAYDKEFKSYVTYMEGQLSSYQVDLKRQQDAESEGKTEKEKEAIAEKYKTMAQNKYNEIKQLIAAKQGELQAKLNTETESADKKVTEAIAAVSKERGILIVLNKTAVYLGGVDITEDVIAKGKK